MCAPTMGIYSTGKVAWVCSCDAFINNAFLICKHLVNGSSTPVYREVRQMSNFRFFPLSSVKTGVSLISMVSIDLELQQLCLLHPFPDVNFNREPSADQDFDSSLEMATALLNLFEWVQLHLIDLENEGTSLRQIEPTHEKIMKNVVYQCTEDVSQEVSNRMVDPTWKKDTTLFLN